MEREGKWETEKVTHLTKLGGGEKQIKGRLKE